MNLRERIAWGLVGTAIVLAADRAVATPDCDPAPSTTTTTTRPVLFIEPPHLVPPATLDRLPETAMTLTHKEMQ